MTHPDDELVDKVASAVRMNSMAEPTDPDAVLLYVNAEATARAAIAVCIEEAAKLCEDHGHSNGHIRGSHKHLAAAIRSLSPKVR